MGDREKAIEFCRLLADCIRDAGHIPNGHLYAMIMATGCTMDTYMAGIELLKAVGLIEEKYSELI